MIIRGTPNNKDDYIKVNSYTSEILHNMNFVPKYINNKSIYYKKNNELLKFLIDNKLEFEEFI